LRCGSGIKMNHLLWETYETTAMLEKVCQPQRSLHEEITVMWWKMKFRKVTCFAFIEICIPISHKNYEALHAHSHMHAHHGNIIILIGYSERKVLLSRKIIFGML
jgi:hypothetical protein